MSDSEVNCETDIEELCFQCRDDILNLGNRVKALMSHSEFKSEQNYQDQHSEMKANIMLCYRHLEDARMRIGKVVQAYDEGKSAYPR